MTEPPPLQREVLRAVGGRLYQITLHGQTVEDLDRQEANWSCLCAGNVVRCDMTTEVQRKSKSRRKSMLVSRMLDTNNPKRAENRMLSVKHRKKKKLGQAHKQ